MTKQHHSCMGDMPLDEHLVAQYAMACLMGTPDDHEWADIKHHLATCTYCRSDLEDLIQMLMETNVDNIAEVEDLPVFDLSLLPPWLSMAYPDATPTGVALIVCRACELVHRVTLDLGAMIALPQARLAGAFRAGESASEHHHQIHVDRLDGLDVALDLVVTDPQRHLYRLKVMVVEAQDPFSQAGHRVLLQYEAQSYEAITDTRGCIVFPDVPLSALSQIQLTVHLRTDTDAI